MIINKGISAGITLAFLWAVRPDPMPTAVGWGIVAILMYETLVYCIGYVRKMHRKERYIESTRISREDIRRWADTQLSWPIHEEVS